MKLIDMHIHRYRLEWVGERTYSSVKGIETRFGVSREVALAYRDAWYDKTGDVVVREMDRLGIEKSIVCANDNYGFPDEDLPEVHRQIAAMTQRHPGRLYFACGVDPRRKNALEILDAAIKECSPKYLKLMPTDGFYPNDEALTYRIYETCVEHNLPVSFHTGNIRAPGYKAKYAHPMHLDDVASDFPKLTILAHHMGQAWFRDMVAVAHGRPNIMADFSGWGRQYLSMRPVAFYGIMRYAMDWMGPDRVIFASDWQGWPGDPYFLALVKSAREIPKEVEDAGIGFTEAELGAYRRGNAVRLFNLSD